ncbi:MAG: DUF296 domain-containing protein [Candidatus Diapherotrites archaeon]|nr:DUF296 domain-containing protein [Candidatus Diapherotrites archaeon]
MKNSFGEASIGRIFVLRISKGNEIITEIKRFCKEHKIMNAWVSGIGGARKAVIKCAETANNKIEMNETKLEEALEMKLNGSIAELNNEAIPHIHAVLGKKSGEAFCGHLDSAEVSVVCEILIQELSLNKMLREKNSEIFNYPALTLEKDW